MQQLRVEDHPVLILLFGMDGCPACESYLPLFRAVARKHPQVPAYAIDSQRLPAAADHYLVKVTPTTILLCRGEVEKRFEGEGSRADVEKLFRYAEGLEDRDAPLSEAFFRRR